MAVNWNKIKKDAATLGKISYYVNPVSGGALGYARNQLYKKAGNALKNRYTTDAKAKNASTKKSTTALDNTYDMSDYVNTLTGGGSGGSGGYYTLDISNMLKAYEQQAAADKAVAKQTYDTTRNDLLTSLKRFQEQNAKDVENQQRSYLSDQASLESAIAQADRQNRVSASARGLGGSGLQQLAQLQNLLSQGQEISDLATGNTQKMDALRQALAQYQEDTDTKLSNALATYNNALNTINAQLATNKANAEVQRANSYVAGSGGSSGISAAEAASYANDIGGQLSTIVRNYQTAKKNTSNTTTYAQALNSLDALGLGQNSSLYKQAKNNLISIYKSKHNGKKPKY